MATLRLAAAAALSFLFTAPAAAQPASYVVQLWSFGIGPQPIHLAAGRPVTLTFVNRSGSGHDFTARAFFRQARIIAGGAPDGEGDGRRLHRGWPARYRCGFRYRRLHVSRPLSPLQIHECESRLRI